MKLAPIIISVYDRIDHLKRCVESLQRNSYAPYSELYVISDAAYKEEHITLIDKVRSYVKGITGFKKVYPIFREKNMGCNRSLSLAYQSIFQNYDSFISLEDDIVVSSDFLQFMNEALLYYKKDKSIFSICGFKAPFELPKNYKDDVFFYPCNSPWGIATWKDRWEAVNHDYFDRYSELKKDSERFKQFCSIGFYIKGILKADSRKEIVAGDLRVYYHMFQNNMCSVFPVVSKTQNWGFDGTGEHCGNNQKAWWAKPTLDNRKLSTKFIPFNGYNNEILRNYRSFQDKINGGFIAKWLKYTWIHDLWKYIRRKM